MTYQLVTGRLETKRAGELRQIGLDCADRVWEYPEREPSPGFIRLHLWMDGLPHEFSVTAKAGNLFLIAPVGSPLLGWLNGLPATEFKRKATFEVSEIVASAYITGFSAEENENLYRTALWGTYTDQDCTILTTLPPGKRVVTAYLTAHLPTAWHPLPVNSADTPEYRQEYHRLVESLPAPLRQSIFQGRVIHEFIQGRSLWTDQESTRGGLQFPQVEQLRSIKKSMSWATIINLGQACFFTEEDRESIRAKLVDELFPAELHSEVGDRMVTQTERDLHNYILDRIKGSRFEWLADQLVGVQVDLTEELRRYVNELLWMSRRAEIQSTRTCEFCRSTGADKTILPQNLVVALGTSRSPGICNSCLVEIFYETLMPGSYIPPGRSPRPIVTSRSELVGLLRELAAATQTLPESNLFSFIAKVPAQRKLVAIKLLYQLPSSELRGEIAPDGWLGLLAEAGLLDPENTGSIGTRCVALDGHPCRSLAEKFIDDWLCAHGIPHEIEPAYPPDMELNPSGKRADFKVGSTYIEFFGLLNWEEYAVKARMKQQLATRYRIPLIELLPTDLTHERLDQTLGHLQTPPH